MLRKSFQFSIAVLTLLFFSALFAPHYLLEDDTIYLIIFILLSPMAYRYGKWIANNLIANYGTYFPSLFFATIFFWSYFQTQLIPFSLFKATLSNILLALLVVYILILVATWFFWRWYGKTHTFMPPAYNFPITYFDYYSVYKKPNGWQHLTFEYDRELKALNNSALESFYLPTSFGPTHILATGNKANPPLILLHSLNNSALEWQKYFPLLAPYFRVYAPDILGTRGKSMPKRLNIKSLDYGEWLLEVVHRLGLKQANFATIDSAASLLFKLAQVEPSCIRSSVLITPSELVKLQTSEAVREAASKVNNQPNEANVRKLMGLTSIPGRAIPDELVNKTVDDLKLIKIYFKPIMLPLLKPDELQQLTAPTLLLLGSVSANNDTNRRMAQAKRYIPNLKVQLLFDTNALLLEFQVNAICSHILLHCNNC